MHLRERRTQAKELGKIVSISMNDSESEFTILKPHRKGKGGVRAGRTQNFPENFMLEEWAILPCSHFCGLYLEGHRKGDPDTVSWMTSMVEKRLDSHRLITVSGQCYQLIGDMIDDEEFESALSSKFLTAFQKGFPRNWKNLLQEEGQKHKAVIQTHGPVADALENVDTFITHSCQPSFNIRVNLNPAAKKAAAKRRSVTKLSSTIKNLSLQNNTKTDNTKPQANKLAKQTHKTSSSAGSKRTKSVINRRQSLPTPMTETSNKLNGKAAKILKTKATNAANQPKRKKSIAGESTDVENGVQCPNSYDSIDILQNILGNSRNKKGRNQPEQSPAQGNKSSNQKSSVKESRKSTRSKSRADSVVLKALQNSPVTVTSKSKTNDKGDSKDTSTVQDENYAKPWTKREITLFNKVTKGLDENTSNFFSEVAEKMGKRSEEECRKHFQEKEEKQNKKPAKKTKEKPVNEAKQQVEITANKGTMKRKRQLKEYMENFNVGYEDEYFDSTPFKTKKPLKIPRLDMDNSFKMIADELGGWKSPGVSYVSTPGLKYSGMPTPQTLDQSAITPRVGGTDRYVHKILKQRKGRRINKKSAEAIKPLQEISENPIPESLGSLFEKKKKNPENDVDSDEDFDDYFTDC